MLFRSTAIVKYQCLKCLPGKDHWTRLSASAEDLSFLLTWGSHTRHTGRYPKRTAARTGTESEPTKKENEVFREIFNGLDCLFLVTSSAEGEDTS